MFTSQAYKEPSIMVTQLKEYLTSVGNNNNWSYDYINGLLPLVDEAYEDQYSIFKYNTTIVTDLLQQFQNELEQYTIEFTNNNVTLIPKFTKVYNTLSELVGTPSFIVESESITNIAQDQFVEGAKDLQKKSDETFQKAIPFVFGGLVLYFVAPRIISAIGDERRK